MVSNALATYPFHWIGMETIDMETIGMDTYGCVAGVADAPLNALTQQDRMLTVVRSVPGPTSLPPVARQTMVKMPSYERPFASDLFRLTLTHFLVPFHDRRRRTMESRSGSNVVTG